MKPAKGKQGAPASAKRVSPPPLKRGGHHNKEENSKKYKAARAALKDVRVGRPRNDPSRPRYDEVDDALAEEFEKLVGLGVFIKIIGGPDSQYARFPDEYQLWKGIGDEQSKISQAYARGKQIAVARYEEEIEAIASTPILGTVRTKGQRVTKDGDVIDVEETRESDMLGHRALLIDTHKWTLAHLRPRKHGQKPDEGGNKRNDQLEALFQSLKIEAE